MKKIYIPGLMLLISFGSIGAVAFTPGLPMIARFFGIADNSAELCVTLYLVGYALGQLCYGPLINRFGSRITIIIGALIEIGGATLCIASKTFGTFELLLLGRLIMAIGAGSGLTLAFTITSKLASADVSARIISLLTIAFAITPGIGVFIGGLLLNYFDWDSSFYFMVAYGALILTIGLLLPEVVENKNHDALKAKVIAQNYLAQLKSVSLVSGGLLVGSGTCFVYTFAALAPFIALKTMHMTTTEYGSYNFIPVAGMICGSLLANQIGKKHQPVQLLKLGLIIASLGVLFLIILTNLIPNNPLSLFGPMFIIYLGFTFVFGNSSALALSKSSDKSNASAVMSFINMGMAVIIVTILTFLDNSNTLLMPILYVLFIIAGIACFRVLAKNLKLIV